MLSSRISWLRTASAWSSDEPTASAWMCSAPTLSRARVTAAAAVPVSAKNSASVAATLA